MQNGLHEHIYNRSYYFFEQIRARLVSKFSKGVIGEKKFRQKSKWVSRTQKPIKISNPLREMQNIS